ncbi:MAG: hypothetical protein M0Q92_08075 [Methanoregula sp.]|jgi:hypothetical protein|nr:hypothetical protein [Methanoregula sp.]
MKTIVIILLIAISVLACGCTSTAPATVAPVTTATVSDTGTPDLVGLWTGTTTGHINAKGFRDAGSPEFNITEQKGIAFTGYKEYPDMDGKMYYEEFSGVINKRGEIFIAEKEYGVIIGDLIGPDTLELSYVEDGDDAKAFIILLNRQKI